MLMDYLSAKLNITTSIYKCSQDMILQGSRRGSGLAKAKKDLDTLDNDTKANFHGKVQFYKKCVCACVCGGMPPCSFHSSNSHLNCK